MDDNKIQTIRQLFSDKTIKPDDDINVSVDQTENLIEAIRNGLEYPQYDSENGADYNETIVFMERLCKIFKWEIYERNTLGSVNKKGVHGQLQWYVVILLQWISGYGLGNILVKAIEDKGKNQRDVKVGFFEWEPYDGSVRHNNFIIAETLEAIEEVILFRISNYFLRFSEEYKKQHNIATRFDNDWYEFVEYGTTNKLRIVLQQSGFKRESSQYIIKHAKDYVITDEANIWLDRSILECSDNTTRHDAEKLQYNVPELFKKS